MSSTQTGAVAAEFRYLEEPLRAYKLDLGDFPTTEEGLAALKEPPPGKEGIWKGPYEDIRLSDPWGNPYQYRFPTAHENVEYDLFSLGTDGVISTDDIRNWEPHEKSLAGPITLAVLFALVVVILISAAAILVKRMLMKVITQSNVPHDSS